MNFEDRKQILSYFLSEGYQLDEKALDFLINNPNRKDDALRFLRESQPKTTTLTYEDVTKLFATSEAKFEIIKSPHIIEKPYSSETVTNYFSLRYDFIKNILQRRIELVNLTSINKIGHTKQFSLITLIREIDYVEKSLVVDDKTGSLKIFLHDIKSHPLLKDEVVGIVCKRDGDRIKATSILSPNMPTKREITRAENNIKCVFLSDFHLDNVNINRQFHENYKRWCDGLKEDNLWFFILGGISDEIKQIGEFLKSLPIQSKKVLFGNPQTISEAKNTIFLDDPSTVKLDNITLFLSSGNFLKKYEESFKPSPENMLIQLIRKRHLNPTYDAYKPLYEKDPYILDTIPDIIALSSSETPTITNYKGITTLTTGSFLTQPTFWVVNLHTRETIKIDFT